MDARELPELSPEPIARGRTASVYSVGDDRIVKLLEPGFDPDLIEIEATKMDAAERAEAPVPTVHGVVVIDGRPGLVMDRVDGDVLIDEIVLDPFRVRQWSRVFALAHADVLGKSTQDLEDVRDVLRRRIERVDLDHEQRAAALRVLDSAPDGDAVLHGDFHPGNVMVTKRGTMAIDWIDATRGHPGADIARTLWFLSPATISGEGRNRRALLAIQSLFRRWYLGRVTSETGVDRRVVDAWRLPVVAARITEGVASEDEALRAEVDRLTGRGRA
jgi:aminoglycoside phosphotransferase (APT) family kinase protein